MVRKKKDTAFQARLILEDATTWAHLTAIENEEEKKALQAVFSL